jgi:hypothetical protein
VSLRNLGVGAALVTASAAIVVGGSALANAAARATGATGYGAPGYGAPGAGAPGSGAPGHGGAGRGGGGGGSADTAVTGAELAKVTDAMKAKDAAVTVTSVQKDPDGSYDVYGTKAGAQVAYDVSKDLSTFTARTGGPGGGRGGHGGPGGSADTQVTGVELTRVTNAMKAKDSAVTVTSVQKDPDGSYDVYGTKAGAQVAYDVSKDLSTFTARTARTGGPGGPGGPGHQGGQGGPQQQAPTPNA